MTDEIEDMTDAVVEGKPPRISVDESRANIAAIQALYLSAESGRPVSL